MKYSRSGIESKASALPVVKFENCNLTSFAGIIVIQKFFVAIHLAARLAACFGKAGCKVYRRSTLFLQLVVHILLGFRELRHCEYYRDDPLVRRLLGLKRVPDVATLSRFLAEVTNECVENLRRLLRDMVFERIRSISLARITLDFDGSVQSTKRHAEGSAVGFNKKKKGARSYYPLFCTVAQTGQVLDFLHRPGNVHDSNGAAQFIVACILAVQKALPGVRIEVRLDSAFFSDEIVTVLDLLGVEFTISVPFERFTVLKAMIEGRKRWNTLDPDTFYFEASWKPDSWSNRFRFIFIRRRAKVQRKGPIQLDLFIPFEYGYEFKVIVTNKEVGANAVTAYHEGRGSQEAVFGELKSQCHADYVPVRRLLGNQVYLLACLFAHNLGRELQMRTSPRARSTTMRRATLWIFEKIDTVRRTIIQRAGRLTVPHGRLTLTLNANRAVHQKLVKTMDAIAT